MYGRDDDDFAIPLSMTFTRYHVLLLFSERVVAVSLVTPADRNTSQVMDEDYCSDVNIFKLITLFFNFITVFDNKLSTYKCILESW